MEDLPADETTTATIALDGASFTSDMESFDDQDWVRITGVTSGDLVELEAIIPASQDPEIYISPIVNLIAVESDGTITDLGIIDSSGASGIPNLASDTIYFLQIGDGDTPDIGEYEFALVTSNDDYSSDINTAGVVNIGGVTTGVIETDGDVDFFRLELVAGETYHVYMRVELISGIIS